MKVYAAIVLALVATSVSGQQDRMLPAMPTATAICKNCSILEMPLLAAPNQTWNPRNRAAAEAAAAAAAGGGGAGGGGGGRKLAGSGGASRMLLGAPDGATITSQTQYLYKLCPVSGSKAYDWVVDSVGNPLYGQLVVDNGICSKTSATMLDDAAAVGSNDTNTVYGSACHDLGPIRPNWETYGWSLFKMPAAVDPNVRWAWIQGINLQLIGTVGAGHDGSTCSVTAISFAIFNAQQAGSRDVASSTPVYSKTIDVTGGALNHASFTWTQQTTGILYTDIYDILDNNVNALGVNLTTNAYYWLRIKVYSTLSSSKRCFVYWAASKKVGNDAGIVARWQESAETVFSVIQYTSTCTGVPSSTSSLLSGSQTLWNCWDTGAAAPGIVRRCLNGNPVLPTIIEKFCSKYGGGGGPFSDYKFSLIGYQGQAGDGGFSA